MQQHDPASTGQVVASAADTYETFFVPAIFGQWPPHVLDIAGVQPGDDVLDVGCGTGVLARAAARRLHGRGTVTAIDVNEDMLAVARRSPEPVAWDQGAAEALPYPDAGFDRVVSQFAAMFFVDRPTALAEMARVTRPGGSVTVATWAAVDQSPGYAALIALLGRLFGREAAEALRAPFCIGTAGELAALMTAIDPAPTVTRREGQARFESLEAWIHTDVRGWTLAEMLDDEDEARLLEAARIDLAPFVDADGRVRFPAPALIARAGVTRPS